MKLMNDTEKALQGTLTNERLFCNSVSLDTNELHLGVQPLVDCNKEFFNDTEDCAKTFRKTFQTSTAAARQSGETCRFVFYSYLQLFSLLLFICLFVCLFPFLNSL